MVNRELRRSQEKTKATAQKQRVAAQKKKTAEKKKGEKKGAWKTITQFLKDVRIEMKKVIWPNRDEVTNYTAVVLVTVAVVSTFLLVLDYILTHLLQLITKALP
jgi:preprotein translocase subunit SecE